ncbi:MAG: hypothetical protein ACF8PN_10790 [Phycisphaerales bacterium]
MRAALWILATILVFSPTLMFLLDRSGLGLPIDELTAGIVGGVAGASIFAALIKGRPTGRVVAFVIAAALAGVQIFVVGLIVANEQL